MSQRPRRANIANAQRLADLADGLIPMADDFVMNGVDLFLLSDELQDLLRNGEFTVRHDKRAFGARTWEETDPLRIFDTQIISTGSRITKRCVSCEK